MHGAGEQRSCRKDRVQRHREQSTAGGAQQIEAQHTGWSLQFLQVPPDPDQPEHVECDMQQPAETPAQMQKIISYELPGLKNEGLEIGLQGQMIDGEIPGKAKMLEEQKP